MHDIRLAIFDFDNTLWESFGAHDQAFSRLIDDLAGKSGLSRDVVMEGMKAVFDVHTNMFQYSLAIPHHAGLMGAHPGDDLVQRYGPEIRAYEACLQDLIRPYEGLVDTLQALKARGVKLACYSDANISRILAQMEHLGIGDLFDLVCVAGDRGPERTYDPAEPPRYESLPDEHGFVLRLAANIEDHGPKSHPEILQAILAEMKVRPEQAVMVGDHPVRDVAMARKCGVMGIYAAWGKKILARLEVLDKVHPYFIRICAEARKQGPVDADFVADAPEQILVFLFGDAA